MKMKQKTKEKKREKKVEMLKLFNFQIRKL